MATLREIIYARLTTHAGTAALISDRAYPEDLPEEPQYPCIRFLSPVSDNDQLYRTHDLGAVPRTQVRVQFDCYDRDKDGVEALAIQVVNAWSGYRDGCTVGRSHVVNRINSGRETALDCYRQIVDVVMDVARST